MPEGCGTAATSEGTTSELIAGDEDDDRDGDEDGIGESKLHSTIGTLSLMTPVGPVDLTGLGPSPGDT